MTTLRINAPLENVELEIANDGALVSLEFTTEQATSGSVPDHAAPVVEALRRYFGGELGAIDTIAVAPAVGTPFQRAVWDALRTIPCGHTISYAELADRVGRPTAHRAVGSANGANPIAVVVPCHRVIAADGGLGGYAYGLAAKQWLLEHEGVLAGEPSLPGLG